MSNCPQCGGDLKKSERLKRYYCDDCGYKIFFEGTKSETFPKTVNIEERLTVQELEENVNTKSLNENLDKKYLAACPFCGGEFVFENGEIFCKECRKVHKITPVEIKTKILKKNQNPHRKIGFNCPRCGEKYTVIKGEIYCKTCDAELLEETEPDKKLNYLCPKCKGEYIYDATTGKIACKNCDYQPEIENKEYVIDSDKSGIKTIQCNECGSNSGYDIVEGKIICKSCGNEINKEVFEGEKRKKYIEKDGVVAKRLSTKEIKCQNCGGKVVGFCEYKTEFCPNCGTINVVIEELESLRLEPNKIITYLIDKEQCDKTLANFSEIREIKVKIINSWKKVYVPFWHFHYEGAKYWYKKKRSNVDEHNDYTSFVLAEGKGEILIDDVWISGREEFAEEMIFDLKKIDMKKAIIYTAEALDTMTERYNVGTAEASVMGQDKVYDYIYKDVRDKKNGLLALAFNEIELNFGTYKNEFEQVLIPTWQNLLEIKNELYFVCINGQNGEVKIAGLDLEKKVQKEKIEEALDKGNKAFDKILDVLSWLDK